jgi:hypothetical protein
VIPDGLRDRLARGAEQLVSWADVDRVLATHRLAPSRLLLSPRDVTPPVIAIRRDRRGEPIPHLDVDALHRHLAAGHGFVLYAVDELFPAVRALAVELEHHAGRAVQANLFVGGGGPGAGLHDDAHDVVAIQIAGRKRWRLYGGDDRYPLEADRLPRADATPPAEPLDEVVLAPGDVLCIPRGHWHQVDGVGEPSLHVSFGIERATGFDLLAWIADRPELRDAPVARLRELVLAALADDDLLDAYFRDADATIPPRPIVGVLGAMRR